MVASCFTCAIVDTWVGPMTIVTVFGSLGTGVCGENIRWTRSA